MSNSLDGWIPLSRQLPPDKELVETKIDDALSGCRNHQKLRLHSTRFTHKDAHDPAKARQMAFLYLSHYCSERRLGRKPTQEDAARVWVGGSDGWREQATINYWNKVKKEMR